MPKQNLVFIVNPFSGTNRKNNFPELVANHLDTTNYNYEIITTEYAGHANLIAKEKAAIKTDVIVAVGGDGTVNEIGGALKNTNTILGIIPGGSGNGFCMHLGISRNPVKAINVLNTGKAIEVDTCMLNQHFFLNVAGLGFDARIAYLTKYNKKRGFLHYFITSMKEAKYFKPQFLEIIMDDVKVSGHYTAAVAANASMYGYNFTIAPFAALNDGLLDVMLIKEAPLYKYFLQAYRFLNKSLHKSSLTETYRAKEIIMKSPIPIHCHVDGEGHEEALEFRVSIEPKSIRIMSPIGFDG